MVVFSMRQAARPGRVVDRSGWRGEAGAQDMIDSQCSGCGIGLLYARSFPAWGRSHRPKDVRVPCFAAWSCQENGAAEGMPLHTIMRTSNLLALSPPRPRCTVPGRVLWVVCFVCGCVSRVCVCFLPRARARALSLSLSRARSLSLGTFCGARRNHVSAGGHDHLQQGRRLHRGRRPWLQDPGRG